LERRSHRLAGRLAAYENEKIEAYLSHSLTYRLKSLISRLLAGVDMTLGTSKHNPLLALLNH
jgi:hypothetical protein